MGKRYYCELCDRAFLDNASARKKHLASSAHQQQRLAWYDNFKDKRQRLKDQVSKPKVCRYYLQNGSCIFGSACRYRHMSDEEVNKMKIEIENENRSNLENSQPTVEKWLESKKRIQRKETRVSTVKPDATKIEEKTATSTYTVPNELSSLPFVPPSLRPPPESGWPISGTHFNAPKKSFLESFIENIKQEYNKDDDLKENIKKFRQEAQELENSEALKSARQKFEDITKESGQSADVLKDALGKFKTKVSEAGEEIGKTEFAKQAGRFTEGIGDAAKSASESETFKKVSSSIDNLTKGTGIPPSSLYKPPGNLRMRDDMEKKVVPDEIEANEEATGVVMHKDSVWNQQWENFKNSKVGERISDLRMKYDESDNPMIRASRFVTEKISEIAGGVFGKSDVSEVMTEIATMEPDFSAQSFLSFCRKDVIPNILEAISQNNKEILKDWCTEAPYTQLMYPITQAEQLGMFYRSKVIDLDHIDIAAATKVEHGPVLVVSFQTQQIIYVQNSKGKVVEGSADQVMKVYHVWALCRDMQEMNPRAAWRLIDQSMSASPLLL